MKITDIINEGDVVSFPGGGPVEKPKEISLLKAFGSEQMNIMADALPNKKFFEKPSYFEDIGKDEKHTLSEFELERVKKSFYQAGIPLQEYPFAEVYGLAPASMPEHPMADAPNMPEEKTFILVSPGGEHRFLVDQSGARTYIRMWMAIV